MAIQDSDLFLVNRLGYPQITPQIGPIIDVGLTTGVDYSQYVKVWNKDLDTEFTGTLLNTGPGEQNINNVFDGNDSTAFRGIDAAKVYNIEFRFYPPHPIKVEGLVEVRGGVFESYTAQLYINDDLIVEKVADDKNPEWLSGTYSGEINYIKFTQKGAVGLQTGRFTVNAFKIDGEYLVSNQQVTYLEFGSNNDFDKFNLFDHIKECDVSGNLLDATGTVGEVLPAQNRITLTQQEPNWDINNYVQGRTQDDTTGTPTQTSHHVRADELEAKMRTNDLMLVNRVNNGEYASYKASRLAVLGGVGDVEWTTYDIQYGTNLNWSGANESNIAAGVPPVNSDSNSSSIIYKPDSVGTVSITVDGNVNPDSLSDERVVQLHFSNDGSTWSAGPSSVIKDLAASANARIEAVGAYVRLTGIDNFKPSDWYPMADLAPIENKIQSTDHLLVNRNNASFHCTGADFNARYNP